MTDTLTKQNPLLKSIAAFFVVFGVLPVLVIALDLFSLIQISPCIILIYITYFFQ